MLILMLLNLFKSTTYIKSVNYKRFGISFVNLHNKSPRKVNFLNLLLHVKHMKKVIIIAGITSLVFGACTNMKKATYNDDVYVDPKEEKLERERLAAEQKKKQEEEEKKRKEEELAAQKAKDDANPAYKDPVYDKDDYYDYQYASRLRRFNNSVNGLGYYDDYYTNYYWYNYNPAYYGASIYSSYNWWGPSYCGPSYGFGMGYNWGSPYYGYGYNPYGYSPYFGYNDPYMMGYYNGYNQGFYNGLYGYPYYGYNNPYYGGGWGYFNSLDANSGYSKATYAPRSSHGGGNSGRISNPGLNSADGFKAQYIKNVLENQSNTPKFTEVSKPVKSVKSYDANPSGLTPIENNNSGEIKPRVNPAYQPEKQPVRDVKSTSPEIYTPEPIKNNPVKTPYETQPVKQPPVKSEPIKQQPIKMDPPKKTFENNSQPNFNSGGFNSGGSGNSGGSTPRTSGGSGGSNRPR